MNSTFLCLFITKLDDVDRGFCINFLFGLVDLALKITRKPRCNYFDTDSLLDHSFFVHGDTEEMMSDMFVLFESESNFPLFIHYEIG